MRRHAAVFVVLVLLLCCQQDKPLVEYEPKSDQEQALKGVLLEFEGAVVDGDSKRIENLLHEKASIMIGRDRRVLSKAEYAKILPGRLAENSAISLGTPKMTVSGGNAEIKVYMSRGEGDFLMVFHMAAEDGRWYIAGWEY